MKRLSRYFFEGLLILVPFVATVYVIYFIFDKIDGLFRFSIPGMGILFTIGLIFTVGFVTSNFITHKLVELADNLFSRLPLVKMIYASIKDLLGAFVGDKRGFNKPVQVALSPENGICAIGFVTNENLDPMGLSDSIAVYLPQSYNFAGNLIVVPKDRVKPINCDSGDVMAFVVSGGVSIRKIKRENSG
jgi:uncharacterized membrane protein